NIEKWFNNGGFPKLPSQCHDPLALEHRPSITLDESLRGETPASVCNVSRSPDESIAQSKRSNKVFQKACFDSDMRSLSEDSKGRKSSISYDLRSFSAERWLFERMIEHVTHTTACEKGPPRIIHLPPKQPCGTHSSPDFPHDNPNSQQLILPQRFQKHLNINSSEGPRSSSSASGPPSLTHRIRCRRRR
ncbi:hypothetical protein KUCAC02_035044, partial [Chaenocephalus aceratus]